MKMVFRVNEYILKPESFISLACWHDTKLFKCAYNPSDTDSVFVKNDRVVLQLGFPLVSISLKKTEVKLMQIFPSLVCLHHQTNLTENTSHSTRLYLNRDVSQLLNSVEGCCGDGEQVIVKARVS